MHPEYADPLELSHWNYLEAIIPVFTNIKIVCKRLEADGYVTGCKAVKFLHRLLDYLEHWIQMNNKGIHRTLRPIVEAIWNKLKDALRDVTWVWQMAFLA